MSGVRAFHALRAEEILIGGRLNGEFEVAIPDLLAAVGHALLANMPDAVADQLNEELSHLE